MAGLLGLAGCQQPVARATAQEPVPVDGVGYVVLNAPVVAASRDLLVADMGKLIAGGAREIQLGINSPGGEIAAAEAIVDYMARQHAEKGVSFRAYNIGVVASAATYIFLNAQSRYTAPKSAFLFHAAYTGTVTAETVRDKAAELDAYEKLMRATLKAHSHLSDAETLTYVRRLVVLGPEDARRDGIIDGVAAFTVPKGAREWIVTARPITPPGGPAPPPQPQ